MTALCGEVADGIILTRSTLKTGAEVRRIARRHLTEIEAKISDLNAHRITLTANINAGTPLAIVASRYHPVNVTEDNGRYHIVLNSGNVPMVHISTCYVNGARNGTILEQPVSLDRIPTNQSIDPQEEPRGWIAAQLAQCKSLSEQIEAGNRDSAILAAVSTAENVDH